MHRGKGTDKRIVFVRQTASVAVNRGNFDDPPEGSGAIARNSNSAGPVCSGRGNSTVCLAAVIGGLRGGKVKRNVAGQNLDKLQARVEIQAYPPQRLAVVLHIQLDGKVNAMERKVVGRRLPGKERLRPRIPLPGLANTQAERGAASQLELPAVKTRRRRTLVVNEATIGGESQIGGQFDMQSIHGTRRQCQVEGQPGRAVRCAADDQSNFNCPERSARTCNLPSAATPNRAVRRRR